MGQGEYDWPSVTAKPMHAAVVPAGCGTVPGYRRGMDLRAWLLDAHGGLRTRANRGVIDLVPAQRWTEHADGGGSSIAWLLLHLARHQDLALTTAIRNHPPLFLEHREALGLADAPTFAGLPEREDPAVSAAAAASGALVPYVDAVFDATHGWLERLSLMAMATVPDTARRLEHLALLPPDDLDWLFSMWDGREVSWFVEWPVIGHGNAHIGEAIGVRNRLGLSPF